MAAEEKYKKDEREFRERLNRIYEGTSTNTQEQLASVLGIKQSSISDAQRRGNIPESWLHRLTLNYNLNPKWILFGSGSKLMFETLPTESYFNTASSGIHYPIHPSQPKSSAQILCENTARFETISTKNNLVNVYSSHYSGLIDEINNTNKFDILEQIPLPEAFINEDTLVFRLFNKNMEPTIPDKALIGVNTQDKKLISGEIYAFCLPPQDITVARVFHPSTLQSPTNLHLNLISDNAKFPQHSLLLKDAQQNIVGRVFWTMHYL